jgi:hypothetical protein
MVWLSNVMVFTLGSITVCPTGLALVENRHMGMRDIHRLNARLASVSSLRNRVNK